MAKFWLINNMLVLGSRFYAGAEVDDATDDTALIRKTGGLLYLQGDPAVDAAAEAAQRLKNRAASPEDIQAVMFASVVSFRPSAGFHGHMSFETDTPFTIVGSGAGPVEVHDNGPTVLYSEPATGINEPHGFTIDRSSGKPRLKWTAPNGEKQMHAMISYYGTFQLAAGGTALVEMSLARDGVQEADHILVELSGNRPNFVGNTSPIIMLDGESISPMIENIGSATNVQAYSSHISVVGHAYRHS